MGFKQLTPGLTAFHTDTPPPLTHPHSTPALEWLSVPGTREAAVAAVEAVSAVPSSNGSDCVTFCWRTQSLRQSFSTFSTAWHMRK